MDNRKLARQIAEESIVLMKNEGVLPLSEGTKVAVFGRNQVDTLFSGNGSGATNITDGKTILNALKGAGFEVEAELAAFYEEMQAKAAEEKKNMGFPAPPDGQPLTSGFMYEIFGQYTPSSEEFIVPAEKTEKAAAFTDTAILVLGRNAGGEECDRHENEDYYLTASEKKLAEEVCTRFAKVILIMNTNGVIDLAWTKNYPSVKAILFAGILGEEGALGLADIVSGKVSPSGRLTFTYAEKYGDYPSAKHFTWDKMNDEAILTYESYGLSSEENGAPKCEKAPVDVYLEDIYIGYRYFDAFGVKPLYGFGCGLSYTTFEERVMNVVKEDDQIKITVRVANTGAREGKKTVLVWLKAATNVKRPVRQLVGFEKTELIQAGESQVVTICIPLRELASYNEDKASYEIEQGTYTLTVEETPELMICVPETLNVVAYKNRLSLLKCNEGRIDFLEGPAGEMTEAPCKITLTSYEAEDVKAAGIDETKVNYEEFLNKVRTMTDTELAALCVGYGSGIPFSFLFRYELPSTAVDEEGKPVAVNDHPTGFPGYVSPAMPEKGLHSVFYKDGPAGVGEMAWPTQMLQACSFNRRLWYDFGNAVGYECDRKGVDLWLAPAENLHRNPLGGRNFEYYGEDPFLAGTAGCEVARGAQENHEILVCPKHFAANEQETFRRGSNKRNIYCVDSVVTERALREVYLKPFEMVVRGANVHSIMSSFNRINGTFAAGNDDLLNGILREEWGFKGAVVTDWGDMDFVVDGADAVECGNDIVMPGGPPVIEQILKGYEEGRVTREHLETAAANLYLMAAYTKRK